MNRTPGSRFGLAVLMAVLLAGIAGCGLVSVDMTSSPAIVRSGDPVTFDIKLTNQSPCPVDSPVALLVPFIAQSAIDAMFAGVPPDAPPEILEFIQQLRDFIDDLCTGGQPTPPTPPVAIAGLAPNFPRFNAGCRRTADAIACEFLLRLRENRNPMTFGLFDGRVQCEVDDQLVRCHFELPLSQGSTAMAAAPLATQSLTCLTPAQLGISDAAIEDEFGEIGAICFVGTFPTIQDLGPNEMAAGQVVLPARGAGVTRNFIIAMSPDAEEAGVCKGGSEGGEPCDLGFLDCTGGTCSPGICHEGEDDGQGCEVAGDCMNGTCLPCGVMLPPGALPIDCTTTYVSPEPIPVTSLWGLAALAIMLVATGSYWLRNRRAHH